MINIIFYCNWGSRPIELLERYKQMTKNNLGIYNTIYGTSNIDEAHVVIFIEGIPRNFDLRLLNNKKIICFPREPHGHKNWKKLELKHGYTYDNIYHVVTNPQFINKSYDFLKQLIYTEHKKKLSAIISNKKNGPGYQLRRNLLINFAKKYPNTCDIYGAGWNEELGTSYKGPLGCYHKTTSTEFTKFNGLIDYKYSICIENCSKKNYFTEKFTDAILCWTIPIYFGCPNISEYFPEHSYYVVDITKGDCLEKIVEIINKPIKQQNIEALIKARDLILNKYNIWSTISNILHP